MSSQDTVSAANGGHGGREAATVLDVDKRLLIDGQLVATERTFASINPATGDIVGYAPDAGVAEAEASIAAARRAFDTTSWSTDVEFRIKCLDQFHQALLDNLEELRELTIADVGATVQLTRANQLEAPIRIVRYYADLLREYPLSEDLGEIDISGQRHKRWVEKEAAGVVSAIVAYNYPTQLALAKIIPALAAGCTVVLKAAPDTPLVTLALGEIIAQHTDIPAGVVNVISSSEIAPGELMTTHPDVDVVTFTGSTPTGRRIMAAAADTMKKVFTELGGKSAMIVLEDADFAMAAKFAAGTVCSHAGQGCALTTRLLVPRAHHDEIAKMVAGIIRRIPFGDPTDPQNYMGPLVSGRQREKVDAMVQRAIADGAELLAGGTNVDPGFFYEPTVLAGVDPKSEIAQEEVFGPVLAIIPFDDDDDAVRIANDSIYGLSGAVMSASDERAIAIARRIRTGTMGINGGNYFGPDVPFGGYKQSGIGRECGREGLEEFLETKAFAVVVKP
ncbi:MULTISPECIES: aldehyde dehydrogenase family protein [Rhodococcus]|uniref:Aldehyde dehydrogenase family protein n=1 Tax=Rhodococcus oxybenzonivorans TaxID=1990687 RepID=A0AAE5A7Q1_9NOCA|nr:MULTISPECIES: aldehyde dehydrogenase family protein [Rhodococcus]MDV7240947.1 aldehyde dehydrogenase family protein [Rhodococcus oxybenzonivorans]MDV7266917.1 aldehyde dehydrogenase family protein [Rhodococcus oxybenzonivorans]MDV7273220.1 aldehyde dehydrogenase family protein [Rhodococcus oxybenzonivorans]MDV7333042.1 aldehyde dehydrogenase family protein [Rhodococcus oxybenzonivorans]MDV7342208.1 aldehyde dehydrogenase family protein [Rhodococcus oxybenzonivorans]